MMLLSYVITVKAFDSSRAVAVTFVVPAIVVKTSSKALKFTYSSPCCIKRRADNFSCSDLLLGTCRILNSFPFCRQ